MIQAAGSLYHIKSGTGVGLYMADQMGVERDGGGVEVRDVSQGEMVLLWVAQQCGGGCGRNEWNAAIIRAAADDGRCDVWRRKQC